MTLMQQLIGWQQEKARKEHLEPYMVLQFHTIKEIVRLQPKTTTDLLRIKGIGPVKVRKYGDEILKIVRDDGIVREIKTTPRELQGSDLFTEAQMVNDAAGEFTLQRSTMANVDARTGEVIDDEKDAISVTEFVTMLDTMLRTHFRSVRVQGEVVGFKRNASGHAYFEIKDRESVLRCMVFSSRYEIAGVDLADGMEIVVTGYPNYHKQYGFGFVGTMIELYGEGALKKAYEELKETLRKEGLLSRERKRALPQLPEKIGLITSRSGAAIGDFMMNVGQYGYKIIFCQSRVEGAQAIDDLIDALTIMSKRDIDLLVIVRGGGSLESLQAFNNEHVVRMIAQFPVPVVAGVGHEQDETLATLVADKGVSTPTAAARSVRESWDQCEEYIRSKEQYIYHAFDKSIHAAHERIDHDGRRLIRYVDDIVHSAHNVFDDFSFVIQKIDRSIHEQLIFLEGAYRDIFRTYERMIFDIHSLLNMSHIFSLLKTHVASHKKNIMFFEKMILHHDPRRNLRLGYSITRDHEGRVVRKKSDIVSGESISVQVSDGMINADVK